MGEKGDIVTKYRQHITPINLIIIYYIAYDMCAQSLVK